MNKVALEKRRRKLDAKQRYTPAHKDQGYQLLRFVDVKRETVDEQRSSVRVTIATENPVERYDEQSGEIIREVLLMDGLRLRGGKAKLPIVDSHDRSTVANVLGSVRGLEVRGDELQGEAFFARDRASQDAFQKLMDGHIDDFSITASGSAERIDRGKSVTLERSGEILEGPAALMREWEPTDASLVAAGADVRSTVHRSYVDLDQFRKVERTMDAELLKPLHALGMPESLEDPESVITWMIGNMAANNPPPAEAVENEEEAPPEAEEAEVVENEEEPAAEEPAEVEAARSEDEEETEREDAKVEERKRAKTIRSICDQFRIERAEADKMVDDGVSVDVARTQIMEQLAMRNQPVGTGGSASPKVVGSGRERFEAAVSDAFVQRCYSSSGIRRRIEEPAAGSEDYSMMRIGRIAEEFCERAGVDTRRMSSKDVALVAMENPNAMKRHRVQRDAFHNTGSFANLLLDAANKSLQAGWEEAPYTWTTWARQAPAVDDLKDINRTRFSEVGNPEAVAETQKYPEMPTSDAKETYAPQKFGGIFSISWEAVVNDDLDAISRVPAMQGQACRRKQNKSVYDVLTANANMSDGGALFNTSAQFSGGVINAGGHANLAGSGGAISTATLNSAFTSIMTKKGLVEDAILGLVPQFLIVPVAISATAQELVASLANPAVGGDTTGSSGVANIYGPGGQRALNVVVEAVLDAASSTAWYLSTGSGQTDTVELTPLRGEESPVMEENWNFHQDIYEFKVRQTWGVSAIDYRGLYKNAGA